MNVYSVTIFHVASKLKWHISCYTGCIFLMDLKHLYAPFALQTACIYMFKKHTCTLNKGEYHPWLPQTVNNSLSYG